MSLPSWPALDASRIPKVLLTTVCFRPFLVYPTFLIATLYGPSFGASTKGAYEAYNPLTNKLRAKFSRGLSLLYSAIVDADTTTLITYGSQEGVAVGYIPKRRHGQPSYAPIISSEGRSGLSLGMDLRAGNVHASKEAWAFLQSILNKLPSSIASSRTRVRLDGAFYNKEIIEPLDQERLGYVVVAKMTRPLRKKMVAARYEPFARGWEAAEFTYTPFHWNAEHRFVAVRRPVTLETDEIQQRLFTFSATLTTGCW